MISANTSLAAWAFLIAMNIICLVVDAPQDEINSLTGKVGSLEGVNAKACYAQV